MVGEGRRRPRARHKVIFANVDEMKMKVRAAVTKKPYNVQAFYKQDSLGDGLGSIARSGARSGATLWRCRGAAPGVRWTRRLADLCRRRSILGGCRREAARTPRPRERSWGSARGRHAGGACGRRVRPGCESARRVRSCGMRHACAPCGARALCGAGREVLACGAGRMDRAAWGAYACGAGRA